MTGLVVRDATPDDAPDIARVHVRSWQAAYQGLIDEAYLASLDEDAGPECGEVSAIYALADAWGRGVGRALMDAALAGLASGGFTEVMLWVLEGNERAIRFYERAGFQPDGATKIDNTRGFALHELRYHRPVVAE